MNDHERANQVEQVALKHLSILEEYADAIQIHLTWVDSDGDTQCLHLGRGNWHARRGMVHEFIDRDIARTNADIVHTEYLGDPDDDE